MVMTPNQNSPDVLREEILADARRESEATVRRARQEAETLLAKTTSEAENVRHERLGQARQEAARQTELILATVPLEAARLRLARIEAVLHSVHDDVHRRLAACEDFDYREVIIALAAEAVSQMAGDEFVIKLSPADCVLLGHGLVEAITRRVERSPLRITLAEEPTIKGGGVIVEDAERRQVCDNRFSARLNRLWPELRRQIAMHTSLVAASSAGGGGA